MTQQESLAIISQMIAATQQKMEQSGGCQMLLWGYLSLAVTAIVLISGLMGWSASPWCWFAIPAVGLPLSFALNRKHPQQVNTYTDGIIGKIWTLFGTLACVVPVILILSQQPHIILFVEMLLLAAGATLTGAISRFQTLTIGGITGIIIACSICFIPLNWLTTAIVLPSVFIVTLIVPGHTINAKGRRHA